MKRWKKTILMLTAALVLLAPSLGVRAAESKKNFVEVKSGSTEAKVVFTVENVLAMEGTVTSEKKSGFIPASIEVSGAEEGTISQTELNKVVFVGNNTPSDLKLTINMQSLSPMEDGRYKVTLKYAITTTGGKYKSSQSQDAYIYVGIGSDSDDDEDDAKTSASTSTTSNKKTETTEEEVVSTTVTDRLSGSGLVDYSGLRTALDEAEALDGSLMKADLLERLTEAMEDGYEALESESQEAVDAAAEALNEILQEIEAAGNKGLAKKSSGGLSLGKWLPIILGILALLLLLGVLAFLWWRKKKKAEDYDGAPMVDYEIGDDDEDDDEEE